MSPEEDRTRDAVDSEPKHYQLSYSGPQLGQWTPSLFHGRVFWPTPFLRSPFCRGFSGKPGKSKPHSSSLPGGGRLSPGSRSCCVSSMYFLSSSTFIPGPFSSPGQESLTPIQAFSTFTPGYCAALAVFIRGFAGCGGHGLPGPPFGYSRGLLLPLVPLASLVFLVALASGRKCSEVHALSGLPLDVASEPDGSFSLRFLPEFLAKNRSPGDPSPVILIKPLTSILCPDDEDRTLCPVRALRIYPRRICALHLFISWNKGYAQDIRRVAVAGASDFGCLCEVGI